MPQLVTLLPGAPIKLGGKPLRAAGPRPPEDAEIKALSCAAVSPPAVRPGDVLVPDIVVSGDVVVGGVAAAEGVPEALDDEAFNSAFSNLTIINVFES